VDALGSAGLLDLQEAAGRPEARPSAAQLLPGTALSEGIPRLERLLLAAARAAPPALDGAAAALVGAGGKRVRPLLALLSARAAHPGRRSRGRVALAVAAELIHSATLLHDDVIDDGLTRRGLPAPRVAYGNSVSVLAGDWLLTTALDLALRSRVPGAVEALVRTLRELVAGEARQLSLRGSTDFTFRPTRSSMGFHVVNCSGNSRTAVITSSPAFHSKAWATATAPALAPVVTATSSGFAPIN